MKIAFVTTQSLRGSTVVGRVLPLAKELSNNHDVHVLAHGGKNPPSPSLSGGRVHFVGEDPFVRTPKGKKRLSGIDLLIRMKANALRTVFVLLQMKPDVIIIVKPLPQNVLAAWWYAFLRRPRRIILDADDFELTAQKLSSIWQRAAIHWSERKAVSLAHHIVVATPFLADHFAQLSRGKAVTLMPTGVNVPSSLPSLEKTEGRAMLYLGSVSISSGHRVDLLPEILKLVRKKVPRARLIVAGSGDDIESLKAQCTKVGVSDAVEWTGRFSSQDVPALLRRAAVLVDPVDASISNRAKSSYRAALCAAAGMPIVTSNIGIRPMHIPASLHGRCFAKPGDTSSYSEHITHFLKRPLSDAQRESMRSHARQFSWKALSRKYSMILDP